MPRPRISPYPLRALLVRLPAPLLAALRSAAKAEGCSQAELARRVLEDGLARRGTVLRLPPAPKRRCREHS